MGFFDLLTGKGKTDKASPNVKVEIENETITDADGNVYQTVKIGNQVWTVENLRTTIYNDRSTIPLITDSSVWVAPIPAYCWYKNDIENKNKYGALYNWYAVDTKMLAPTGWHVSSDEEWKILEEYLITNGYNWDGTTDGNRVAKALAAKTDWRTAAGPGTIGNDLTENNSSGFSALPGGCRDENGAFGIVGYHGIWWSASRRDFWWAYACRLYSDHDNIHRGFNSCSCGFSIRLVKD